MNTPLHHDRFSVTDHILAFEAGELDETETIELFQHLIDTGLAWSLQGSYGRTAMRMLEAGYVTPPTKGRMS